MEWINLPQNADEHCNEHLGSTSMGNFLNSRRAIGFQGNAMINEITRTVTRKIMTLAEGTQVGVKSKAVYEQKFMYLG